MSETTEGLVVRSTAGFVDVRLDDSIVQARLRGRLKNTPRTTDLCVIGDHVLLSRPDERSVVVEKVLPRRSRFSRRQPGKGPNKEDVLVANLDQLLITFCHGRPVLKTRLLDRFLVIAEHQRVQPIIVMNKADLREPGDGAWQRAYESIGYPILTVSAGTGQGLEALGEVLQDKISAFVGPSGVGKSSLINRIVPGLDLDIASVSDHHGKGRHTTRVASLHALAGGGFLADTPGIRELATWALPVNDLDQCFPELSSYRMQCAFRSCSHTHEPGCAVVDALNEGDIDPGRYESYVRLREEATG
ncbi:MAG: ribosome small subunit-dependent GTPase A [Deltaproteobacteria bacterium]|nr:ribosome small subunit-dependent GTPase A [Deltaproteobacteria bacterium]NND30410.1 ribosome small subunit-dependent GTPase A [Myxococcales bacterium]MBT8464998.1 ribosome small subunit-dependent GTPase A [Deltaproteobacteria bacterium]MBT8480813.1 ribosome small subunit-dependent GTPase A [Deltaproteobacteria bacterium]NNK09633.1 ribosome small subunit-dependent GTPase A [Myxococcales bacterium]